MSKDNVVLLAGMIFEHQLDNGTWSRVPSMTSLGPIGEQSQPKEKTTLSDTSKKYGAGLRDAADKSLKGQYIPYQDVADDYYDDYVLQQAFLKRCKSREEFPVRVIYPDGDSVGFLFQALGFELDEGTQEDWKMWTVNGKQNSLVVFGVSVTGTATVAVAGTTQLTRVIDPETMTVAEAGTTTWTSSDAAVATVDTAGLVTGVSAGTAIITAEVRGVVGSLEVTVS